MKKVTADDSVHVRIGETLKAVGIGKRTPPEILEVVADQEHWHKRLRELRYPVIGWEIDTVGYKTESGRKKVDYILRKHKPWPDDPTGTIGNSRGAESDGTRLTSFIALQKRAFVR